MPLDTWMLFCAAAFVVIVIPGPLSLLMVSNSLQLGVRRSWPAFLGEMSASLCLLMASALGLGALLTASAQGFEALKLAGALYLFYLAWNSWRHARQLPEQESRTLASERGVSALFRQAFLLGASNPKDLLFFAAFLPQFIQAQAPLGPQLLVMSLSWALIDLGCKLGYGLLAQGAGRYLRSGQGRRWFNRASAALFAAAGAGALWGSR
ncbi:LysE family translocator [Pseudomonas sp. DC3000-4b1]|uniref:LysE family translocator n=1 Tax=unclassified Pseudomonas TaxID=196821 RepID=UPI003CEECD0C